MTNPLMINVPLTQQTQLIIQYRRLVSWVDLSELIKQMQVLLRVLFQVNSIEWLPPDSGCVLSAELDLFARYR